MAMAGIVRSMVEKVGSRGRTGFSNHHIHDVKRTMLVRFFGAVNPVISSNNNNNNYQHHLLSRHYIMRSPIASPSHIAHYRANHFPDFIKYAQEDSDSEEFHDVESGFNHFPPFGSGIHPYPGSMDDPAVTRPALFAVEQHNKQQNANLEFVRVVKMNHRILGGAKENYIILEAIDNGVKKTYCAKVWRELQLFRRTRDYQTNLTDKQGTSCSVENAMAVLRNLPDVKSCDDIFLFGSDFLLKDINREMFLNGLQTDRERLAWLQWLLARDRVSQSGDQSF